MFWLFWVTFGWSWMVVSGCGGLWVVAYFSITHLVFIPRKVFLPSNNPSGIYVAPWCSSSTIYCCFNNPRLIAIFACWELTMVRLSMTAISLQVNLSKTIHHHLSNISNRKTRVRCSTLKSVHMFKSYEKDTRITSEQVILLPLLNPKIFLIFVT